MWLPKPAGACLCPVPVLKKKMDLCLSEAFSANTLFSHYKPFTMGKKYLALASKVLLHSEAEYKNI